MVLPALSRRRSPTTTTTTTERVVPWVSMMRCRLLNVPPEVRIACSVCDVGSVVGMFVGQKQFGGRCDAAGLVAVHAGDGVIRDCREPAGVGPFPSVAVEVVAEASDSVWGTDFRCRFLCSLVHLRHRRTPFRFRSTPTNQYQFLTAYRTYRNSCDGGFRRRGPVSQGADSSQREIFGASVDPSAVRAARSCGVCEITTRESAGGLGTPIA